ncbi:hypothetical protein RISK_006711 [Rhodopirellula islandica]|uniref:Uncharacterized protein n=1 Tax=Rhodopirellula islandica TaxID=595434 RepID=A0A0J1B2Z0_RHOIS|nr:hypothetical protein RISK_006711 [Rhodopirellula islandica]
MLTFCRWSLLSRSLLRYWCFTVDDGQLLVRIGPQSTLLP